MYEICDYSIDEYCEKAREFHGGHLAPGMIIAGFMVDLACKHLPEDTMFDVICETAACLPDAVQLLSPCTVGNQWMKIMDVGRFAMTFYDKHTGDGVRVHLEHTKLEQWPAIKEWFLKIKPKEEQDKQELYMQIIEGGSDICSIKIVKISPEFLQTSDKKTVGICPICNEAFRSNEGPICPACKDASMPYVSETEKVKSAF